MIMNHKYIYLTMLLFTSFMMYAAPRPNGHSAPCHPSGPVYFGPRVIHHRPSPPPPRHHHNQHVSFWSGFLGGFIGSTITTAVLQPQPQVTVIQPVQQAPQIIQAPTQTVGTPVIIQAPKVWIEGHYESQVQNGVVVQVWVPGHYR